MTEVRRGELPELVPEITDVAEHPHVLVEEDHLCQGPTCFGHNFLKMLIDSFSSFIDTPGLLPSVKPSAVVGLVKTLSFG